MKDRLNDRRAQEVHACPYMRGDFIFAQAPQSCLVTEVGRDMYRKMVPINNPGNLRCASQTLLAESHCVLLINHRGSAPVLSESRLIVLLETDCFSLEYCTL